MELVFYCLIAVLILYVLNEFFKLKITHKRERDLLEDEKIYDPDAGVEFTIEEAEHIILKVETDRLIPDDELQKHFSEDYHEVEYLRRLLAQHHLNEEADVFVFEDLLNNGSIMPAYNQYGLYIYEIKPEIYFGWVYVFYSVVEGRGLEEYSEYQLAVILNKKVFDSFILQFPDREQFVFEILEDLVFLKSRKKLLFADAAELFLYLTKHA